MGSIDVDSIVELLQLKLDFPVFHAIDLDFQRVFSRVVFPSADRAKGMLLRHTDGFACFQLPGS